MSESLEASVKQICEQCGNDRTRMMDIVRAVQEAFGCVSGEAMDLIAGQLGAHRVEVEGVVSFYAFLSQRPKGKVVIRLCDDIIDEMKGSMKVAEALKEELGIDFGETTADGTITLEWSPFIGMGDQAPAAMVNDTVITNLTGDKAREMARSLRAGVAPAELVTTMGDGNNAHDLVRAMVCNNMRGPGSVIFEDQEEGVALEQALALSPAEVIRDIKTSRLRGRGGAGFPTGLKWEFTRKAEGKTRYVICNADEGEPGTFKDRVILTERADLMIEGMTITAYAIGAQIGVIYLRAEYAYLRAYLEQVLKERRDRGLLGKGICAKDGFDFDIRIQMGAGAYICGEETSLISSCEGLRGDPKIRPPFPAEKGYLAGPTTVNNVETYCCVARILDKGPGWFTDMGSKGSAGTKLLSVSGDCTRPGVYELPFGVIVEEVLKMAGAERAAAVQVGGPSGQMIGKADFGRSICYDDLATGGSFMVFNESRDVLAIAAKFMDFFIEEGCGSCTPCRVGNVLLKTRLDDIRAGNGCEADLAYLRELGESVKFASRCGLGQTSPNPVLSTMQNFGSAYRAHFKEQVDGFQPTFDLRAAVADAEGIAGRQSVHFEQ